MKKLLALLLALAMLFAFSACGDSNKDDDKKFDSVEDQAEDFLDRFEDLVDDLEDAIEDNDEDEIKKIEKKIEKLEDEYEEILEKLEDEDEDLADEFKEDVEKLTDKLDNAYDQQSNLGNAVETLPPSSNNTSDNNNKTEVENPKDSSAMQDYIDSIQSQLDAELDAYAQMGMSIKVVARGNSLAYVYRFNQYVDNVSTLRDSLKQGMSTASSQFTSILRVLKTEVPSAESVIVEYQNSDGSVIYSEEFK